MPWYIPAPIAHQPLRNTLSDLRFDQYCRESGELTADSLRRVVHSYLKEFASNLLLTNGIPRAIIHQNQPYRMHMSGNSLNPGHFHGTHKLPRTANGIEYRQTKSRDDDLDPVFHKLIYQIHVHYEADTLTDEMIENVQAHGFVGMRFKNKGALAMACFVYGAPELVSVELCYTDFRRLTDMETWISTGAVFRVIFRNKLARSFLLQPISTRQV